MLEPFLTVDIIQLFGLAVNRFRLLLANQLLWLICHITKLLVHVIVDETALDHGDEIALICRHHESEWATPPCAPVHEVIVERPMRFVAGIKYHIGPACQLQHAHCLAQLRTICSSWRMASSFGFMWHQSFLFNSVFVPSLNLICFIVFCFILGH